MGLSGITGRVDGMTRRQKKQAIAAGVLLVIVVVAVVAVGARYDLGFHMRRCVAFFRDAGPWPFFTAMAVLPALGFPVSAFSMAAGPVFGPTLGVAGVIACATLAIAINLTLCYWIAASAMRPLMERLVKRLGYPIPELPGESTWEITLLVRIIPGPPVFLQSYLLGLARVPFGTYLLISLLVQVVYLGATILAGDALMRGDWWALAVAGGLFVVVGAVMHRLRKRFVARRRQTAP
jgi:uncharacterized membrane protein YdjX (TVP38/TMEM64 family)